MAKRNDMTIGEIQGILSELNPDLTVGELNSDILGKAYVMHNENIKQQAADSDDSCIEFDTEREFEKKLPPHTSNMIENIRANNDIIARQIAVQAAENAYDMAKFLLDYNTECMAHMADSSMRDTVKMCRIINNRDKQNKK